MTNSRRKGAGGEREIAHMFQNEGYETARRGIQVAGEADVIGVPYLHLEIKRYGQGLKKLYAFVEQAQRDAKKMGGKPTVILRTDGKPWLVVQTFEDWIELYREWESGREINE